MQLTRVEQQAVALAVEKALAQINQAMKTLEPVLVVMGEEERAHLLRPPEAFPEKGEAMAREAVPYAAMGATVDYQPEAVLEDLANAAAVSRLAGPLAELQQRVNDTVLVWRAEAYEPSLAFYRVLKAVKDAQPALRQVIDRFAPLFASRRTKASKAR